MKSKSTVLTREERDVLILAAISRHPGCRHLSNEEIGQRLGVPVDRVKTIIHQACVKLEAHNRNQAIVVAIRRGEISLNEFFSLDELAETLSSLGPDTLRTIARLVRQEPDFGSLPGIDEQIVHADRRADTILTKRERDVLILVARGLTNMEIADNLCMSVAAVRTFLNRACSKLGARKRSDAVMLAVNRGEIGAGEIFSLNELVQMYAPLGSELLEKVAQLMSESRQVR